MRYATHGAGTEAVIDQDDGYDPAADLGYLEWDVRRSLAAGLDHLGLERTMELVHEMYRASLGRISRPEDIAGRSPLCPTCRGTRYVLPLDPDSNPEPCLDCGYADMSAGMQVTADIAEVPF